MKLVIEQGERAGQELRLSGPSFIIGRGQDSGFVLTEHGVSRQHARLERGPQGWTVTDLGTTNGTFVNGRQIPAHRPIPLQPGDRLSIGSTVLALQRVSSPASPTSRARRHPLVSVIGAILFLLVLAALVTALVIVLQPGETATPTPTQGNPLEQLITVVPVPTQLQEVIPSVVPLIPTEFRLFPLPPTETPSPLAVRGQSNPDQVGGTARREGRP